MVGIKELLFELKEENKKRNKDYDKINEIGEELIKRGNSYIWQKIMRMKITNHLTEKAFNLLYVSSVIKSDESSLIWLEKFNLKYKKENGVDLFRENSIVKKEDRIKYKALAILNNGDKIDLINLINSKEFPIQYKKEAYEKIKNEEWFKKGGFKIKKVKELKITKQKNLKSFI